MRDHVDDWVRRLRRGPLLPEGEGLVVGEEDADPARCLPHRAPMLLLDAILAVDPIGARIRAQRVIDARDPVFAGHFPDAPIYPGVLLVESMAQAALAVLPFVRSKTGRPDTGTPRLARFTRVRDAAFIAPIHAGDEIEIHAQAVDDGMLVSALGQIYCRGALAAYAVSEAYIDG